MRRLREQAGRLLSSHDELQLQTQNESSKYGWYDRGYIPHFDGGETSQVITFRLCDSMPREILEKWRDEVSSDVEFRKNVERYLDSGYGECWLKIKGVAQLVQDSLLFHNNKSYTLTAWVVMPNHVHILLTPLKDQELSDILHDVKSYTAHQANNILKRNGQFWQHESFDRYIRNREHFANVINYIEENPVKAGLCRKKSDWKFSSAYKMTGA